MATVVGKITYYETVDEWRAAGSPGGDFIGSPPSDTWTNPDSRKEDPWDGMPDDYAGIATFIPNESRPVPPWEGKVGAEAIPDYGTPEYARVAGDIIEKAYEEGDTELLTWAKNAYDQGAGVASNPASAVTNPLVPAILSTTPTTPKALADFSDWLKEQQPPTTGGISPWLIGGGVLLLALVMTRK